MKKSIRLMERMNTWPAIAVMLAATVAIGLWVVFHYSGTGDAADSIVHYQFARYAFLHPENLLDSWAKPVFVLFAAPAASFGFEGIKIFNLILALATGYLLFRITRKMASHLAWMAIPFLFAAPLYFILIFSGLTEYLFAFVLVLSVFLVFEKRFLASAIILSFLPFVRSEGLLIIPCFILLYLWRKQYKLLPWFLTGHIVYALAGWIFKANPLWMFTENAYAGFLGQYGSGDALHFLRQMPYVAGVPLAVFYVLAVLLFVVRMFYKSYRSQVFITERLLLILLPFLIYLIAHSIFWKFGLFHSMGLKRVMIGVLPLMIPVVIEGLDVLYRSFRGKWVKVRALIVMLLFHLVVVFPFSDGPAAIHPAKDLEPDPYQKSIALACSQLSQKGVMKDYSKFYLSHPYMQLLLDLDPFDHERVRKTGEFNAATEEQKQVLIVWDCLMAKHEDGVVRENLESNPEIEFLYTLPEGENDACFYFYRLKL